MKSLFRTERFEFSQDIVLDVLHSIVSVIMLFFLAAPEYNQIQSNTTRILVHLSSGVAEIYEQHQDLIGRIQNDIVEIEATIENRIEKFKYIIQEGVFIVSTKNTISTDFQKNEKNTETGVYIYAKRVKEMNSKINFDEIVKEYEFKKEKYEKEEQKILELKNNPAGQGQTALTGVTLSNTQLSILLDELNFLKRVKSEYEGSKKGI